jgi:hypothetical protein
MKKFQANVSRELRQAYPDRRRLECQCISSVAFVKSEAELLDSPVWIMIINVVALDMLKAKLPPGTLALKKNHPPTRKQARGADDLLLHYMGCNATPPAILNNDPFLVCVRLYFFPACNYILITYTRSHRRCCVIYASGRNLLRSVSFSYYCFFIRLDN